jgi:ABC-type lipoprotein release transport system permease subunit
MTRTRLVLRRFAACRPAQLGIVLGVAIGTAILTGALLVGDSVRQSLREQALLRIGGVDAAMATQARHFRDVLALELERQLGRGTVAPALSLRGVASAHGGRRRALAVQILGVDERFFALAPRPGGAAPGARQVFLNTRLAEQLEARIGDRVVLRLDALGGVPREAVLGDRAPAESVLVLEVGRILDAPDFGHFDLSASQLPPRTAIVALPDIQRELDLGGRANLLVCGGSGPDSTARAESALRACWRLDDAGLERREISTPEQVELVSKNVFLDPAVVEAVAGLGQPAMGVATYLANELRSGERAVPYSLIAALGPVGGVAGDGADALWRAVVPEDLARDEIVINTWVAEDLGIGPGDILTLRSFAPDGRGGLHEIETPLRVRRVVPVAGLAADPELMPPFPGISGSATCGEWDPSIPIDLDRIRERDEAWWEEHGGTPKAFVSLELARTLWGSERFGFLTALRISEGRAESFLHQLRKSLDPGRLGLVFRDLRTPALRASSPATDFGGLFIGLSLFLLVSAFLLVALLITLDLERRAPEIGTLLALGFRPGAVLRLLLAEIAALGLVGCIAGALLAGLYSRAVILGLGTIWRDAVAGASLEPHLRLPVLAAGGTAAFLAALVTAAFALRRQRRRPAGELLAERSGIGSGWRATSPRQRRRMTVIAIALSCAGVALALLATRTSAPSRPALSFGAGFLVLLAGIVACRRALAGRGDRGALRSRAELALVGAQRRPGRSLATIALIASGAFLVIVVGVHRKAAPADPSARTAGTGGFALIGQTSIGYVPETVDPGPTQRFQLGQDLLADVDVVPLRVHDGDEASCLNLNRPQVPRILGVRPAALADRSAFSFAETLATGGRNPWQLLGDSDPDGATPAIADAASVTWSLHRGLGDTVQYVGERGETFELRIVATLSGSILQGSLIIDEQRFLDHFPTVTGWRGFLVDAPPQRADIIAQDLMEELADAGLELESTARRLAALDAVQNTYILVFQALGGLGLVLGSAGLAVVLLRNVFERRSELALLGAVGFRRDTLQRMLIGEHATLLGAGLGCGAVAALIASLPMTTGPATLALPLGILLVAMISSGLLWVWLASRLALRGPLLDALRDAP